MKRTDKEERLLDLVIVLITWATVMVFAIPILKAVLK